MIRKVYTVSPKNSFIKEASSISRGSTEVLKPAFSKPKEWQEENQNLKELFIDYVEKAGLLLLTVLFLVVSVFFAHKLYQYFMVRVEKSRLSQENAYLTSELTRLTSKDMLEEKAKRLGLRPPKESELIRVP